MQMLGGREGDTPAIRRLRAARDYLVGARLRANAALRATLAQAALRRKCRRQASILHDLQVRLVVAGAPLVDVIRVEVLPDYGLYLEFSNGDQRVFSMAPFMAEAPYNRLTADQFALARVDYGTVVWPGDIDIDPETLHDLSRFSSSSSQ